MPSFVIVKRLVALVACVLLSLIAPAATAAPQVLALKLAGSIQPASQRYLERGIEHAAENNATLVLLELDTPGGLLVSLRAMTTAITQSRVPVAVYVTPPGARAASAGFFLLLAADVAAMAPGTNAGAAHPVTLGGGQGEAPDAQEPAVAKAVEDAAALIRALAAGRGRPVDAAEQAVRESLAYSAEEARERGLIDLVAADRSTLLNQLDGRTIRRFHGPSQLLELSGARVAELGPTLAERLLMVIADPQLAYLLLLVGALGLITELLSPGAIIPGIVGGISLLLAFYALSILPVSWVGALLMLVGIALLVAEAFVTSWGLLAIAGIASFVIGSLMLVDTPLPGGRIGPELVVPSAVVLAAVILALLSRALRARRAPVTTGLEGMIGEIGELTSGIDPARGEGTVFVHGEYWTAVSDKPVPGGTRVRVERVDGSRLLVTPVDLPST